MASSRQLISSQVLGTSASSVTFSSIPGTFKDLILRVSTRTTSAGTGANSLRVYFNGSGATTNYSLTRLNGNGATAASAAFTAQADGQFGWSPNDGSTANTFGSSELYIPSYTSSTNKPFSGFGLSEDNSTTAQLAATADLFSNTSAITSLTVLGSVDFKAGSSFYLYGLSS